jgi:transitional endoplasmic reticulum ATPase
LKKTPVAKNVSFDFLASLTEGFSGADLTELCQRATKSAIRESIEADEHWKKLMKDDDEMMEEAEDPVPVLTRAHFEEALGGARTSVKPETLLAYDKFRDENDPQKKKVAAKKVQWPADNSAQFKKAVNEDEEDLYS